MMTLYVQEGDRMTRVGNIDHTQLHEIRQSVVRLPAPAPSLSTGPVGKPVQVVTVDQHRYDHYLQRGGTGAQAKPVTAGQIFPSASEAGRHLGCVFNEVGQALCRARKAGLTVGKVRGVSFRYYDSAVGGDNEKQTTTTQQ